MGLGWVTHTHEGGMGLGGSHTHRGGYGVGWVTHTHEGGYGLVVVIVATHHE